MPEGLYKSYVLRVWQAGGPAHVVWRASLEDVHTGERLGFAGLEQLFAFLLHQARGGPESETAAIAPDDPLAHPVGQDES
jgi:hypothetical protein